MDCLNNDRELLKKIQFIAGYTNERIDLVDIYKQKYGCDAWINNYVSEIIWRLAETEFYRRTKKR